MTLRQVYNRERVRYRKVEYLDGEVFDPKEGKPLPEGIGRRGDLFLIDRGIMVPTVVHPGNVLFRDTGVLHGRAHESLIRDGWELVDDDA